jgi:hypothetical protein
MPTHLYHQRRRSAAPQAPRREPVRLVARPVCPLRAVRPPRARRSCGAMARCLVRLAALSPARGPGQASRYERASHPPRAHLPRRVAAAAPVRRARGPERPVFPRGKEELDRRIQGLKLTNRNARGPGAHRPERRRPPRRLRAPTGVRSWAARARADTDLSPGPSRPGPGRGGPAARAVASSWRRSSPGPSSREPESCASVASCRARLGHATRHEALIALVCRSA